ncbi:hypothetical protein [Coleofasciculus sp. G2-EDA-02]|uniref:hypothetical protein n=1 Tax=Coleofasciculus sp. G2-EDA-02 TaxID=3069529 RepID=UPI0033038C8C
MLRLYMLPLSIYTCWGNWRIVVSVYSKGLCLIEISHSDRTHKRNATAREHLLPGVNNDHDKFTPSQQRT